MRAIKIKFLGFWPCFDPENNFITNTLRKFGNVVICEDPDYLFYTTWGADIFKYKCVRIFYNVENYAPDFNLCDYAIGFDEINFNDR